MKALIIGGKGMVGRQLEILCKEIYTEVKVVDIEYDMTIQSNTEIIQDYNHIYHLAGIKGSPLRVKERPADYLPMLQFDTNVIRAVGKYKPDWFLYTSSVGVYPPSEVYNEDDVWKKVPSPNDKIPAYIKRMGELSCEAISITNDYKNISIVRPANIYGPFDNFGDESTVIASMIKKGYHDKILNVWGDGTPIRDFIYSKDVARGMIYMVENEITEPINLGSGTGVTIKEIAEIIGEYFGKEIKWNTTKPMGDSKRLMNMKRANSYGFEPQVSLRDGITKTIEWYKETL